MDTMIKDKTINDLASKDLSLADRCDQCGAQAWVRAYKDDLELLFCGHHGNEHFPALFSQGFIVQDDTYRMS